MIVIELAEGVWLNWSNVVLVSYLEPTWAIVTTISGSEIQVRGGAHYREACD